MKQFICPFVMCAMGLMQSASLRADGSVSTIALTNKPIPGLPGANFDTIDDAPTINSAGRVAFLANELIWTNAGHEGGRVIAFSGQQAPGMVAENKFGALGDPIVNDLGQVAFVALTGNVAGGAGVWIDRGDGLTALVSRGVQATGLPSKYYFSSFGNLLLNDNGGVAFDGHAVSSTSAYDSKDGIWSLQNGTLRLVATPGQPVIPRVSLPFVSNLGNYALNGSNQLALVAKLGTTQGFPADSGVLKFDGNSLSVVAQEVAFHGGDFYFHHVFPGINNAGHTAFGVCGSNFECYSDAGVWFAGDKPPAAIAVAGQTVDVSGRSYTFTNIFTNVVLNANDQVAFWAQSFVDSTNNISAGIWLSTGDKLTLVADLSQPLPGEIEGEQSKFIYGLSINANGQVAFRTPLGIWATDRMGNLRLIARREGLLDVDDGPDIDMKTISYLQLALGSGGQDGRYSGFNDRGEIAFQARFTDDYTGIFVSRAVAVPEPSSFALTCAALIFVGAFWRPRPPASCSTQAAAPS